MVPDPMIIRPAIFSDYPQVVACMSTRRGGERPGPFEMNMSFNVGDREEEVRKNRSRFFDAIGIKENEIAYPGQVHSDVVMGVTARGVVPVCDATVTGSRGLFLAISVAD